MSEKINQNCSICGKGYHFCVDCGSMETFTPWRTIVDSVEHYKIFLILRDYTNKYIDIAEAKKLLSERDLNGLDDFVIEIKETIKNIMSYKEVVSVSTNKKSKSRA